MDMIYYVSLSLMAINLVACFTNTYTFLKNKYISQRLRADAEINLRNAESNAMVFKMNEVMVEICHELVSKRKEK